MKGSNHFIRDRALKDLTWMIIQIAHQMQLNDCASTAIVLSAPIYINGPLEDLKKKTERKKERKKKRR